MRDVVIVGAARTPIGSFLGSLSTVSATELGAVSIRAALERAAVNPEEVDEVFMGCVLSAGLGQAPARQASLGAGLPQSTPCTTVNKMCGSGMKTVVMAIQMIQAGDGDIAVAGGLESMSNAPHLIRSTRTGVKMGNLNVLDSVIHDGLWDIYTNQHMGNCAELCAMERNISREAQDAFAIESYARAQAAQKDGSFSSEIVPVTVKSPRSDNVVDTDEEPGRGKPEGLPSLRTAFAKTGTVTAGNASSLSDGAAALVLMSADEARKRNATILARIVAHGVHAQAPEWFTTAPAPAIEDACKKANWSPSTVDLWEINEAFAVVSIANNDLLGIDPKRVNINGGAIALGHPIGASGTRILVTLLFAMARRGDKRGGAALCIGGGEGIALLVARD